jgi:hypothetical protein
VSDQDDNKIVLGGGVSGYGGMQATFNAGAGTDTITLDPSLWNNSLNNTITIPTGGYTIGTSCITNSSITTPYTYTTPGTSFYQPDTAVQINADGMQIKEGGDIKIGGKSLSEAIDKIEERLGILHPNPELEDRWDELKELRRKYNELEKDLLEKEKMWKILKEQ